MTYLGIYASLPCQSDEAWRDSGTSPSRAAAGRQSYPTTSTPLRLCTSAHRYPQPAHKNRHHGKPAVRTPRLYSLGLELYVHRRQCGAGRAHTRACTVGLKTKTRR